MPTYIKVERKDRTTSTITPITNNIFGIRSTNNPDSNVVLLLGDYTGNNLTTIQYITRGLLSIKKFEALTTKNGDIILNQSNQRITFIPSIEGKKETDITSIIISRKEIKSKKIKTQKQSIVV